MADRYELRLPALEVRQGDRKIYCFAVDGKKIHSFAAVSRVRRDDSSSLQGYQRPEVLSHIRGIRRYLESDNAMLPNALVLAFDESVRFETGARRAAGVDYSVPGELVIPVDESLPDEEKPALIVDGQQRSAAIRDADLAEFPVAAVGFIADDQQDQRSQFILVNSTKPLPKGLIHELLPETSGHLPPSYARKRLPARLMTRLNIDGEGPFYGRVASPTSPTATSKTPACCACWSTASSKGPSTSTATPKTAPATSNACCCTCAPFGPSCRKPSATPGKLPPRQSRLSHGAGIQAMGFVMDSLTDGMAAEDVDCDRVRNAILSLMPVTAWTSGMWRFPDGEQRRWNGLQNTPNDIRLLTDLLVRTVRG